jgi:peptidoglycan/LPS O-acetylase OafA/YrhL
MRQPAPRTARLAFADGIRGLAALWVVLFHASEGGHVDHLKSALPAWLGHMLFDWGHLGVLLFFVLSGFVMMHSIRGLAFTTSLGGRFMLRRLLRLTPPYWASIVFVIGYVAFKAVLQGQPVRLPSAGVVAAHALYLQDILAVDTLSVVYWTLCIEIQFYLAFTVLMLARHHAGLRFGAARVTPVLLAISAIAGLPWAFGIASIPLYQGGFLSYWYSFMLGVLVSAQAEDRWSNRIFIGFVVTLVIAGAVTWSGSVWTSLMAAALLLAGGRMALLEGLLNRRGLQFLGLVSYSLYLIHNQITGATAFALKRFVGNGAVTELGLLAAIIVACLLVAALGHRLVERPSIEWSRRVSLRVPRRASVPVEA